MNGGDGAEGVSTICWKERGKNKAGTDSSRTLGPPRPEKESLIYRNPFRSKSLISLL